MLCSGMAEHLKTEKQMEKLINVDCLSIESSATGHVVKDSFSKRTLNFNSELQASEKTSIYWTEQEVEEVKFWIKDSSVVAK